jgi:trigger factor
MLGLGVVVDIVSKKVSEELQKFISENELNILGEPLPVEKRDEKYFDVDCNKELEFDFELGLSPQFDLNLDFPNVITRYEIEPTEASINERIEDVKERFGEMQNPKEVAAGDIVFGVLEEVNESGEKVEEGFSKSIPLNPKRLKAAKLFDALKGKKLEDSIPFSFDELENGVETAKTIFLFSEGEVEAAEGKKLHFRVGRINRTIPAELTEEVFRKVLGDETEVKDEAGFREHLINELKLENESRSLNHFRGEIKKALEAQHEMDFPAEFLKKYLQETQKDVTEDNVEEHYQNSLDGLKWTMIVERIQKEYEEETEIKDGEVEAKIRESLGGSMSVNANDEMMDQYVNYVMGNEQMARQYVYRLMDDKIFGVLEGKVVSEIKRISPDEFEELTKAEEA